MVASKGFSSPGQAGLSGPRACPRSTMRIRPIGPRTGFRSSGYLFFSWAKTPAARRAESRERMMVRVCFRSMRASIRAGPGAPADGAAGAGVGHFPVVEHELAVHDDVADPLGILVRIFEGGEVANPRVVEQRDVRPHARPEHAAVFDAHDL